MKNKNKPTALCMCSVLNCAISVILGKDCTRPGVLWGSVLHLCWKHLSQQKPTFTVMKCFKQSIIFLNFHFRGKLRSSGVLFQYLLSKIIFLWQVAQCLWTGGTPYCSAGDSKLKPTFPSNHHTFIFWMLQFYPNEQIKLHQTKISPSSIQDAVPLFLPHLLEWGGCSPAGRAWQEGWFGARSPALELWLASLAVPTLLPELVLASGWAQLRGRWEAARGTAVGRRRGPCGRQQESWRWWHSRQCHRNLPEAPSTRWAEPGSERGRIFWKKGYRLQTDKH